MSFILPDDSLNKTAVVESLGSAINSLQDQATAIDKFFVLVSGFMVFLMQTGFAMLTAGSVRTKNVKNVLIKNILAFAYGEDSKVPGFIGWGQFALSSGWDTDFTSFFFQWAFAATAATIVSGSVAERTSFYAYLGYAFLLTAWVYPVVSHWVWGGGFLSDIFGIGMIDFAGCSVVHMVGGVAGLVGAIIVGPRTGRFVDGKVQPMPGHSATLATLGTFLLWFGWYGFNPGSTLGITGGLYKVVERCAVTTTLGAAAGGVTVLVIRKVLDHFFDLISVLNGVLAGLVSVTASCAFIEPYAAIVIGIIGAILFNRRELQKLAGFQDDAAGLFYGGKGAGKLLGINLLGCVIIAAWTIAWIGVFFIFMEVIGLLRINIDDEIAGNDVSKHGGSGYPEFAEKSV